MESEKVRLTLLEDLDRAKARVAELEARLAKDFPTPQARDHLLGQVLDALPARVFWKDLNLKYLGCNRPFAADAGLNSGAEIIGLDDFKLPWREQAKAYRQDDREVIENGKPKLGYEEFQSGPDGRIIYLRTNKLPLRDETGQIIGVLGTYEDITVSKRIELALKESDAKYRAMIEAFDGMIYICSKDYKISFLNHALIERIGRDATGEDCFRALHGRESICPWCVNERVLSGETVRWEIFNEAFDRWYYVVNTPIRHQDGSVSKQSLIMDITERKKAEQALIESEARYRRMLNSVTGYIYTVFIKNGQAVATQHGSGCEAVTGYTPEEYEADPHLWHKMVHPEDREAVLEHAAKAAAGLGSKPLEHRIVHKSGEVRYITNTTVPRRDVSGRLLAYDGLVTDISESKRIKAELVRARDAALMANQIKSEFMANMSHEIRTPMNAILGLTKLALRRELGQEQREFLEGVMDAGNSLMQIINDILDFSKIEAGKLSLECESFSPAALCERIIKSFAAQAAKKRLRLKLKLAPDLPERLRGDQGRLRQVIVNLLGNALKFTAKGEVELRVAPAKGVQAANLEPGRVRLGFSVRDTGIGIAKDKLEAIFEKFTQADSSTTKLFGGTGLGLAISRKLVRLMHGELKVKSRLGQGSTFYFSADFAPSAEQPKSRAAPEKALDKAALRPLNILLAEDDRMNQIFAKTLLEEAGHKVSIAQNGTQVLTLLEHEDFDIVLMDVSMPGMDGVQATQAIRQRTDGSLNNEIPILAVTAHALKGDRERFLASGMDGYLAKPVDFEELIWHLKRIANHQPLHGQPGQTSTPPLQEAPDLDRAWFDVNFAGKPEIRRNLVLIFKRELRQRIKDLRAALQNGDLQRLLECAHSLKDSSGVIGAARLGQLAQKLEVAGKGQDIGAAKKSFAALRDAAKRIEGLLSQEAV